MRMGSAGLIVTFDDFGFIERWYHGELVAILDNQALHPLQFSEVLARVLCAPHRDFPGRQMRALRNGYVTKSTLAGEERPVHLAIAAPRAFSLLSPWFVAYWIELDPKAPRSPIPPIRW
jgi:hypothetical protein